jgi:diguanylate cyclase (GGDEF)-like protein
LGIFKKKDWNGMVLKKGFESIKYFVMKDTENELDAWKTVVQMRTFAILLSAYSCLMMGYCVLFIHPVSFLICSLALIAALIGLGLTYGENRRVAGEYMFFSSIGIVVFGVFIYGWHSGVQHFLFVFLIYYFMLDYASILRKVIYGITLLVVRLGLYLYTMKYDAYFHVMVKDIIAVQIINTITIFALCIFLVSLGTIKSQQLQEYCDAERRAAVHDPLTGLCNRRALFERVHQVTAVAMADIDFFKKINDTYGHAAGDKILQQLGSLMQEYVGPFAKIVRWGGEEFVFFFHDSDIEEVQNRMQELKKLLEHECFRYQEHEIPVTLTIGVAQKYEHESIYDTINRADQKLYKGKENGRNVIVA